MDDEWKQLVRLWRQTDAPKGCRTEIIGGAVSVTIPASLSHQRTVGQVHRRLHEAVPPDWGLFQWLALAEPSRPGLYVPDVTVVPDGLLRSGDVEFLPAAEAALVVEVTSQITARHDRGEKHAGYAAAGIPLFLLIDGLAPGGPTVTLYGEPKDGVYRVMQAGPFGVAIQLPEPFDVLLDSSGFPHPSTAATTTSPGTDTTVDSRIASRASTSPTR
jgi:Uma2 family endonuclease